MSKAEVKFPAASGGTPYALDIEDAGSLIVSNPDTMNFTGAGVTVTENPAGTAEVNIPGVQFWTESESAATQQNTRWIPNNAATNVTAVIQPKGNGANTAQRPDGTTTGGNARGNFATDWQKVRGNANEVASGAGSTILGGHQNRASANQSTAGGFNNAVTGNQAVGISNQSTVSGGVSATVGGQSNTVSGTNSFAAAGNGNNVSGNNCFVYGDRSVISGQFSAGGGFQSRTYLYGQKSHASGQFTVQGDAQEFTVLARRQAELTTGATTILTLDGTGSTNPIIVRTGAGAAAFTVWNVVASWVAVVQSISGTATGVSVGDTITQCNLFGFKEISDVPSIIGTVSNVGTHNDASMATASMTFGAANTNELTLTFAAPTFSGGGTLTIRVLCKLMITSIEL